MTPKEEQDHIEKKIQICRTMIHIWEGEIVRGIQDNEMESFQNNLDREKRQLEMYKEEYPEYFI